MNPFEDGKPRPKWWKDIFWKISQKGVPNTKQHRMKRQNNDPQFDSDQKVQALTLTLPLTVYLTLGKLLSDSQALRCSPIWLG